MALSPPTPAWAAADTDGVRVAVRLTPKAKRVGIVAAQTMADGRVVLKVGVSAAPEDGKANRALIVLFAKEWGFAKSALEVVAGQRDRRKVVLLRGKSSELLARLDRWRRENDV